MAGLIMPGQRDTIPITELTGQWKCTTATDESVLRSVVKEEKSRIFFLRKDRNSNKKNVRKL